jgi:parvulin-like peptidyl-prolyl isomerase
MHMPLVLKPLPLIVAMTCAATSFSGCSMGNGQRTSQPVANAWESPAANQTPSQNDKIAEPETSASEQLFHPTDSASNAETIAVIDGKRVSRSAFAEILIDAHGMQLLEQVILLTAAEQRADALGITVTQADIDAAHDQAIERLSTPVINPNDEPLSADQAEALLQQFLRAKNISRTEWQMRLKQRAIIRAIAEHEIADVTITEDMLKAQYERNYGEKVQFRHIQVASLAEATRVRARLMAGKDFELVAREMSENPVTAARGGLARPITRSDPDVTPVLKEAAFKLPVGEISEAVRDGSRYHIIRVERRFPASDVSFENVNHSKLRLEIRDQLTQQRMQELEPELFRSASVKINDNQLRAQFREQYPALLRRKP